jgi:diguanylate cyclase (GGDEF)-like protein/PAS domain S-box-containing protein
MQKTLSIQDITDFIPPTSPACSSSEIYERFHAEPDLMVLAVADPDGRVQGLIERHTFNLKMAAQYGRAVFGRRPVALLMDSMPVMVDAATPLRDFTETMLAERPSDLMRGFIVTRGGRYFGVGTSLSVLKAMSDDLQLSLGVQRDMTEDLIALGAEAQRHQSFLNMVIQNIPAMVMVKQAHDQRIVLLNPTGEHLLGMPAEKVTGKTSHELFAAERAALFDAFDRRALQSDTPVVMDEERFTDADGQERIVQLKKTVLRKDNGDADSILTLGLDLTEQKQAEAQIAHLAHFDPLTGLANRALFGKDIERVLARAQRQGRQFALLCLDLDRFKAVNDSYGHIAGDQLLIEVASRLKKCVRKNDVVARMGGDEFAILQDIDRPEDAQNLAARIVDTMKMPFLLPCATVEIGASVGIAVSPTDGLDAHNLLSRADLAMYRVKSQGRNGWCFYQPEMDEQLLHRLEMEQDLKTALEKGEFELFFQPLLDLTSSEVVSFEALLRWHHPVRGMVPPSEFIPIAEDCGLIGLIGEWVVKTACVKAAAWARPWRVAVNISAVQFRHKSLVRLVKQALAESGLPPQRLELEITESVILSDEKHNLAILKDLRAWGVRIAMDDFGTGYSSLSYLRTFPFDKIKIDQSFVRDLPQDRNALSIIRAITDMAQSLDVRITAEGVETEAQMDALKALNCHEAQGFLIGRPAPSVVSYDDTRPVQAIAV